MTVLICCPLLQKKEEEVRFKRWWRVLCSDWYIWLREARLSPWSGFEEVAYWSNDLKEEIGEWGWCLVTGLMERDDVAKLQHISLEGTCRVTWSHDTFSRFSRQKSSFTWFAPVEAEQLLFIFFQTKKERHVYFKVIFSNTHESQTWSIFQK